MAHPISPGTLLRQRYLIQNVLGQGGFGRTYLALDQERFNEPCVLKEFTVPHHDESLVVKSRNLFQREASILYQIQHPQIPRFWAAFEDEQRLFLVQSYVEGPTYRAVLSDRKQKGRAFSEAEILHFLNHLLPVLTYIHERDIIHRDISPENLILRTAQSAVSTMNPVPVQANLPVLIDFGAVKEATSHWSLTTATTRVGKVGYAPPEQLQTGKVYANSDLYALAASCLALLTGREPRTLLDSQTLTWQWDARLQISDELGRILKKMLSVYPGDRFQTANEVLVEIQPLLQDAVVPTLVKTSSMREVELPTLHSWRSDPPQRPRPGVTPTHAETRRSHSQPTQYPQPEMVPTTGQPSSLRPTRARPLPGQRSSTLPLSIAAVALATMGAAMPVVWSMWANKPANSNEEMVWVAGNQVKQEDANRMMESPPATIATATTTPPPGFNPGFNPGMTTMSIQSRASLDMAQPLPVQRLELSPQKLAIVQQGNLPNGGQNKSQQSYSFEGAEGQVVTVAVTGAGVTLNVLNSRQQVVNESAQNARRWTGQLTANDQYYVQVLGAGAYSLDMAVTPPPIASHDKPQPILFDPGTTGVKVMGTTAPTGKRRYTIRVLQGQTLAVRVLEGNVGVQAIAPDQTALGKAQPKQWAEKLPVDGEYQLDVVPQSKAGDGLRSVGDHRAENYAIWVEAR